MCRPILLTLAVVTGLTGTVRAGNALDLVNDTAQVTLATGDIDALKDNVDRLFASVEEGNQFRPGVFLEMFARDLGMHDGRKKNGAAAIALYPNREGNSVGFEDWVIAVEIGDLDLLTSASGFAKGEFKKDKMYEIKQKAGWKPKFRYARGNYYYAGSSKHAIERALAGKSIAPKLDPELVKRMGSIGMLLHIGTEKLPGRDRENAIAELNRTWVPNFKTEREQEVARAIAKALPELEHGLAWFRYEGDRFQLSLAPVFQKGGKNAQALLELFRHGDTKASFDALPVGNVVAAHSSVRNNGRGSAVLGVMTYTFGNTFLLRGVRNTFTGDWTNFVNIFTEVTRKLDGARFALYQAAPDQGMFSMVGILDTRDPDKFLADLRQLADLAHFKGLDLEDKTKREANLKLIKQLVADLASEEYQVRESATLKLQLIGEPALTELKGATKSGDLEQVRRAERIIDWIALDIKERREALLRPNELANLKPSFVFLDKKEKLAGWDVHQVGVVFPGKADPARDKLLANLFGPNWQRVRLAQQGKQFVVLLGSDVKLLEEALNNLKSGKPGLADTAAFKKPGKDQDHTRFQISLAKILELVQAADLKESKPVKAMTALELNVGKNHVELSLHMPLSDIKSLIELEKAMRGVNR
ncbi:MAG: hypothetical protein AB7K24_01025 [Gemmataceae bacterium]